MKIRKCLITGASSGIGEAFARLLAEKGIDLILTGRDLERLESVALDCRKQCSVEVIQGDVTDQEHLALLVSTIQSHSPDVVVNNAGFGLYGRAIQREVEQHEAMVDTNCRALVTLTLEAAKHFVDKKSQGMILNISSVAAFFPFPNNATYGATKAFVNSFSEAVDAELRPLGIRVLAACPGQVRTRFRHNSGGLGQESRGGTVMSVEFAAEALWKQLQRGQGISVFNGLYWCLAGLAKYIMPRMLLFAILKRNIAKRYPID